MRIMGRPGALLAVVAACLLLAGCGSGPAKAGNAAIIGNRSFSVDQIQQLIDKSVREEPMAQQLARDHKLDLLGRELVRQIVIHDMVTRAAGQEGLVPDERLVSQRMEQADAAGNQVSDPAAVPVWLAQRARDRREAVTDTVLLQQLGERYLQKLSITFDYTAVVADDAGAQPVTLREKAFAKARRLAGSPETARQLIQQDAQAGTQVGIEERVSAVQSPDLATMALFGVAPGTAVAFQPSQEATGWIVAIVTGRHQDTPPAGQPAQVSQSQLAGIGLRMLQPIVDQVGLELNPRYGVWDPVDMNVAASEAQTRGLVVPARGTASP
jgi:hypothetical protein